MRIKKVAQLMIDLCNHQWSTDEHKGLESRICHKCNIWKLEFELEKYKSLAETLNKELVKVKQELDHIKLRMRWDEIDSYHVKESYIK